MALRNLFNRARSLGNSPGGRRPLNQGRGAGGRGVQGGRRSSGSGGLMGLAQRFLGRGGTGGTTRRR